MVTERRSRGDNAEKIAIKYLQRGGCKILGRNYHSRIGEIDIICQRDNVIHFVEVKSTYTNFVAEENVTKRKLEKIIRTANKYILKNHLEEHDIRFDLIVVKFLGWDHEITYYPNINIDL